MKQNRDDGTADDMAKVCLAVKVQKMACSCGADICCCCCSVPEKNENFVSVLKFPRSEYQVEYTKEFTELPINKRFVSAGVLSKGKPEQQPQEYDSSEGIVPQFKGKSICKSSYEPQPPISQLKSFKPSTSKISTTPPMFLGPKMMELEPYSHSVHSPMPLELARKTAPTIPLWIKEKLVPTPYETRYDLTSSYQADFCGAQIKPRRICLVKSGIPDDNAGADCYKPYNDLAQGDQITKEANTDLRMWNYVNSLLYRTTTGSTYLPPSVHGEPNCHPSKYTNDNYILKKNGGRDLKHKE